jgi:hypothetical protein
VSLWVHSGAKQDFIGVNVSNPGEAMLIEEKWFQSASTALNELDKGLLSYVQGVRAESALHEGFQIRSCEKPESAKPPGIPVMQLSGLSADKPDAAMDVLRG